MLNAHIKSIDALLFRFASPVMPKRATTTTTTTTTTSSRRKTPNTGTSRGSMLSTRRMKVGSAEREMRCRAKIEKLVCHERNKYVCKTMAGYHVAFQVTLPGKNGILYSGLTKRLKLCLYPNTEEDPMMKSISGAPARKRKYYRPTGKTASVCGVSGAEHGKLVHGQIDFYFNQLKQKPGLSLEECFPGGKYDKCTQNIMAMLSLKKWHIVGTEMPIADDNSRVATAIDILVYDSVKKNLVLLEVKTGYEGEEYGPHPDDDRLCQPFQNIINCPKNRHFLQLMSMKEILFRQYKTVVDECYIVRVLPKTKCRVTLNKMTGWCFSKVNRDNLYQMLVESRK